jgi:hypothetical protein
MHIRCWFIFLIFLSGVPRAYSKGPVDLIVISGGGLSQPIEITDPSPLKAFNPWMGQFADWQAKPLADAPCSRVSFEVFFYLKWPGRFSSMDRGDLKMIYATRYCSTGLAGYVYLPGPGQRYFGENNGTIIRREADGKWHPATADWDSVMSDAVAISDQQRSPDMMVISGGELKEPVEITNPELLTEFNPWTAAFVDWDHPVSGGRLGWEYEIRFFKRGVEPATHYDLNGLTMIYGMRYCVDEEGGPGSVHLAGRNDQFGPENARMVWEGTYAGRWSRSTRSWKTLIERTVAGQGRTGN